MTDGFDEIAKIKEKLVKEVTANAKQVAKEEDAPPMSLRAKTKIAVDGGMLVVDHWNRAEVTREAINIIDPSRHIEKWGRVKR